MKENPGKKPFKKSDDDFDFEILNALEGHASSDDLLEGEENTIELSLDDDDLQFDDDAFEQSGEFSFDEGLSAGLEEELMKSGSDLGFDDSFEEMDEEQEELSTEKDAFALDLGNAGEEFSFDEEEMSLDLDKTTFESDVEGDQGFEAHDDDVDSGFSNLAESYGAETRVFTIPQEEIPPSFGQDIPLDEELNISPEEEENAPEIDMSGIDEEEMDFDEQKIEIDEEFADLEQDIEQGEEELLDEEEELQGKSVIAVGEDVVIDLGHEDDFEKSSAPLRISPPIPPTQPEPETMAVELSEEAPPENELMPEPPSPVFLDLQEEEESEFDSMAINLNDEVETETEEPVEQDIVPPAPEMPEEAENASPIAQEQGEQALPIESLEPTINEDIDVREFLGLTLRLEDTQMQEFEGMIQEAETLQTYLEELESHQPDIKETIYQKLLREYNARKRVIFEDDAFTGLLANVEHDLQDMLDQRQDFTATVSRLNEELEEITVRHLVGEYTDQTLSEKKEEQTAEIALWNEKTDKIQAIIERYQQAVDAERLLNPLRHETPPPQEVVPEPEPIPSPIAEPEPSIPETFATEDTAEVPEAPTLPEQTDMTGIEEEEASDESFDDELLGGLSDLTQQAFETGEEEGGDLFGEDAESDEFDAGLSEDEEFEGGDFLVDDLSGLEDLDEMEDDDENISFDYEVESESGEEEEEPAAAAMIACKKCGRQTPATQKFCVHCGGKAQ